MAKIILMLIAGISILSPKYKMHFIKTDDLVYLVSGDISYINDGTYKVVYKDIIINESLEYNDLSFGVFNNNIYILFKGDSYKLNKYSLSGNLIKSINLYNTYSSLDLLCTDDNLYLYGGIDCSLITSEANLEENNLSSFDHNLLDLIKNEEYYLLDGFIMDISGDLGIININIYKGEGIEEITKLYYLDNKLYMVGTKDYLSGGIYGNGGLEKSYFVISLNDTGIEFREIYKDKIINLSKVDEKLVVCTSLEIYSYDSLNSLILALNLPFESIFSYVTFNYSCFIISEMDAYLIDLKDGSMLYTDVIEGYDYICASDYLYFKKEDKVYILDLLDESLFLEEVNYCYYKQIEEINGLYGKYKLESKIYDPYFDRLIYGEYDVDYKYKCKDLEIIEHGKCFLEMEANVKEGGIYPTGYHLLFSGIAYLNDQLIYQNHEIAYPGEYILELVGTNAKNVIKFSVSEDQTKFIDNINTSYDLYVLEEKTIKVKIESSTPIDVICVNDQLYNTYLEGDFYYINLLVNRGDNGYLIKYGISKDVKLLPINYFFKVLGIIDNVVEANVNVISSSDNVKVDACINTGNEALRVIVVKMKKQGNELIYYYPIGNTSINLNNSGDAEFSVYLGLYNGSTSFDLVKVFDGDASNNIEIEVNVLSKQEYIEELEFVINKNKGINSIQIKDNYINLSYEKNYKLIIIFSCISVILSIIIFYTRYKKKIKKNK